MNSDEKSLLLAGWFEAPSHYPNDKSVIQLFEEHVEKSYHSIAVAFDGLSLTYTELNSKANFLSNYLLHHNVKLGSLVAICLPRSLDLVVSVLSVLKIGAAYVPMDPHYPDERLKFMLEDSRASALITHSCYQQKIQTFMNPFIFIDRPFPESLSQKNLDTIINPNTLAYVIYTSGTTGNPKGVMVAHSSLINIYEGWKASYKLKEGQCHLQMASFSFDVFTGDWIRALCSGGSLILCTREQLLVPEKLLHLIQTQNIAIAEFVPAVLRELSCYLESSQQKLEKIKILICASDTWTLAEYQRFKKLLHPDARLINSYGVTEATIDSTYYELTDSEIDVISDNTVPIGKPFPNIKVIILDKLLQPVPVGIRGELYIGGLGVALGYLNLPLLTAEKFIKDPFSDDRMSRLYKTGDECRKLSNGNIEFIGRTDFQVKIRGCRIEVEEIASTIRQYFDVENVLVRVHEDIKNDKQLIAYLVTRNKNITVDQLRESLSLSLPDFMIPKYFIFLKELPLNVNGKIDLKKLPFSEVDRQTDKYIAPSTEVEKKLTLIWSELLGISENKISASANFFHLGGHSLLATRVISRVWKIFHIELPLMNIFTQTTVKSLSTIIEGLLTNAQELKMPELVNVSRELKIPLSFAQQRLWFLDQMILDKSAYNIPIALRLHGELDKVALQLAVQALIARHEVLRTCFQSDGSDLIQVIADSYSLPIVSTDYSEFPQDLQSEYLKTRIDNVLKTIFDLSKLPLMYVELIKLNKVEHVLLMIQHHSISDGWSINIMSSEMTDYYNHFANKTLLNLTKLHVQYADYSVWQREWLQGDVLQIELDYWKKQLSNIDSTLNFPQAKARPQVQNYQGKSHHLPISKELCHSLKFFCQQHEVTLFQLLLTSIQVVLHHFSAQDDIIVGTPVANRVHEDTELLIGFFVNMLALRSKFIPNYTFIDMLKQVKKTSLEAYEHQHLPFEKLIEHLHIPRDVRLHPLFQVMFVFQNKESTTMDMNELDVEPIILNTNTAKFDLTFSAEVISLDKINFYIEYATALFDDETILEMANYLNDILKAVVLAGNVELTTIPVQKIKIPEIISISEYVAPRDNVEYKLSRLWEEILKTKQIGIYDNFFTSGGHSLLAVRLISSIAGHFTKKITVVDLFQHPTIESLSSLLRKDYENIAPDCLLPIQVEGQGAPLFLVHAATGLANPYLILDSYMSEQRIYGISNPYLGQPENEFKDISCMAKYYVNQIKKIQTIGPYYLGGWSFGGVVAFEMAQQLKREGETVAIVILIDSAIYNVNFKWNVEEDIADLARYAKIDVHSTEAGIFKQEVLNNLKLLTHYQPVHYSGRVVLLRTLSDELQHDMLNWNDFIDPACEVYDVPGKHLQLFDEAYVKVIADKLTDLLK